MSKLLSRELKLETLLTYRRILKIHTIKLNEDMRVFGDFFVKSEFTLNYKQADEKQIKLFISQWKDYYKTLNSQTNISTENFEGVEKLKTKMDIDQKKIFDELKNSITD